VIFRREYFGGLLFKLVENKTLTLNKTGADILELTDYYPIEEISKKLLDIYHDVPRDKIEYFCQNFLNEMIAKRILVKENIKQETKENFWNQFLIKRKEPSASYLSAPEEVDFNLTWNCNQKCTHCYVDSISSYRENLSKDERIKIIDELISMKVFKVILLGGEPLLSGDIFELIVHCKDKVLVSLSTNATSITCEVAEKLKNAGLKTIQVSLEGATPAVHDAICRKTGAFENTIKGIKNLVKMEINVSICTVISKRNIYDVDKIIGLAESLGAISWRSIELKPAGFAKEEISRDTLDLSTEWNLIEDLKNKRRNIIVNFEYPFWFLRQKYKDKLEKIMRNENTISRNYGMCSAKLGKRVTITPDGYVFACEFTMDAPEEFIAGDLRKQSFKEIWNKSGILSKFRNINQDDLNGKCKTCEYYPVCFGRCRMMALYKYNDFYASDGRCPYAAGIKIEPPQ
jgi:radical SAM protein with 4Fe4S-binding SPASM domain